MVASILTLPRLVCAWCARELRPGPEPTSHGICEACQAQALAQVDGPDTCSTCGHVDGHSFDCPALQPAEARV